jgi:5-methylcytosine-specific restriction endonuclease McrA
MLPQTTELRCHSCNKLLLRSSDDFDGAVWVRCKRCKTISVIPPGAEITETPLKCRCRRWLVSGYVTSGSLHLKCGKCQSQVVITPTQIQVPLRSRSETVAPVIRHSPMDLVAAIEARWQALKVERARKSALTVGLRFAVFQRDGFRCRYCGASPDQGAMLEADHVIPQAAGGPTTLANLVTACWECNHGKGAKTLTTTG